MKIIAIVQARLGSTRYPNKILEKIKNKTLLELLLKRLSLSKSINDIVVAIPKDKSEIPLKKYLEKLRYKVFAGNKNDLLDRYYKAAKKYKAEVIVRITADCPLIDSRIVDSLVNNLIQNKLDFISNAIKPSFPDGLDVSVIKFKTLKYAWKKAINSYDREHVTPYIIKNKLFKIKNITGAKNLSYLRWTVDEYDDFTVIKNIFNYFYPKINFSWEEIYKLYKKKPKLFSANQNISRDEGSILNEGSKLWKRAKKIIPGGNMLLSKRPEMFLPNKWPTYFTKSKGCYIWDLEGKKYIDMSLMGVGTNILGYNHPAVNKAVKEVLDKGNMTTLNCPEEVYLAEKLIKIHPWAEMVKFTRTGGEANAVAIRIARAASHKDNIAICGYHGWHDWYLSANLSDKSKLNRHLLKGLDINGVPKKLKNTIFPFEYNKIKQLQNIIKTKKVGTIIMEVSRNYFPENNFLKKVNDLAKKNNIILIFDECTSGFRQAYGGLHKLFNINPDIAVFGKALGNGYAINAIIGVKRIMESAQSSFISSTFWTERTGPAAALKTLEIMEKKKSWVDITNKGNYLIKRLRSIAKKNNLKISFSPIPSICKFTFQGNQHLKYKTYITQEMLKYKILANDTIYLSTAHNKKIINKYLFYMNKIFKNIKKNKKNISKIINSTLPQTTFTRLN
jgi:glutamate-1-semialdehyde 2,1-aminomutase